MRVGVVILAAGQSTRFGRDKLRARLGGKPVWQWSYDAFLNHPRITEIVLVCHERHFDEFRAAVIGAHQIVVGGNTRQKSGQIGTNALQNSELVLVHDAARPFVTAELIDEVIIMAESAGAAAPRIPIVDTLRNSDGALVDRDGIFAMQTPQGARYSDLLAAHNEAVDEFTDDIALMQLRGIEPVWVEGDPLNFKVTTEADLAKAHGVVGFKETRTGIGYDVHRFSTDAGRPLMIGGVRFDGAGLEGHSDADALVHAVVDALLGALGVGDIGQHFPNSDPNLKNRPSTEFLRFAGSLVRSEGWKIVNIDSTVIAEQPKIMSRSEEIRQSIASAAGCTLNQVSVKATTNEGLGALGRSEGLAAFSVATLTEA